MRRWRHISCHWEKKSLRLISELLPERLASIRNDPYGLFIISERGMVRGHFAYIDTPVGGYFVLSGYFEKMYGLCISSPGVQDLKIIANPV